MLTTTQLQKLLRRNLGNYHCFWRLSKILIKLSSISVAIYTDSFTNYSAKSGCIQCTVLSFYHMIANPSHIGLLILPPRWAILTSTYWQVLVLLYRALSCPVHTIFVQIVCNTMHMWVICLGGFSLCNSCDIGMSDFPDMHSQSPRAAGLRA